MCVGIYIWPEARAAEDIEEINVYIVMKFSGAFKNTFIANAYESIFVCIL